MEISTATSVCVAESEIYYIRRSISLFRSRLFFMQISIILDTIMSHNAYQASLRSTIAALYDDLFIFKIVVLIIITNLSLETSTSVNYHTVWIFDFNKIAPFLYETVLSNNKRCIMVANVVSILIGTFIRECYQLLIFFSQHLC